jgi:hypothetical protein
MSAIKNISLFVPHVFPNFNQKYVATAFSELGDVDRVDFVSKQDRDGKPYNAAYIHFKEWFDDHSANEMQGRLETAGSIQFYHDDSEYYWIVLPNSAKKHVSGERKPRIDLGELNSVSVKTIEKTPNKQVACSGAPKKSTYAQLFSDKAKTPLTQPDNLQSEFDQFDAEASEDDIQMAEIEAELEAEDNNLVSIDYRYIQAIEQENACLHAEIAQIRLALINLDQMYQAEKAKVRAFSNVVTDNNM